MALDSSFAMGVVSGGNPEYLMISHPFELKLSAAVSIQDFPHERPSITLKSELRPASVLALFQNPDSPSLLLTRRTHVVETHKGQIAFPGGVRDAQDRTPQVTALREAEEEMGIESSWVHVVGTLPELETSTGFSITPVIGVTYEKELVLKPNPLEIEDYFWVSLKELQNSYRKETFTVGEVSFPTHTYTVGERRIWGATAAIIKNLLDRLKREGI